MDPGILAAIHRLPRYETVIKELALQSESFRSLWDWLHGSESWLANPIVAVLDLLELDMAGAAEAASGAERHPPEDRPAVAPATDGRPNGGPE